jgi:putative transposase
MLQAKKYWDIDELITYLDEHYGVTYKSKESYYELLKASGISWKKSQKINPSCDPKLVKKSEKRSIIF